MLKTLFVALAATITLALPATDAFPGTPLDPLSGNWTITVGGWQIVTGNFAGATGALFSMARWTGDSFTDDQYAQVVLREASTNAAGPVVRADANGNGYTAQCFGDAPNNCATQIISSNGTANATISGCASSFSASASDTLKISITGSAITVYLNGSGTPIDSCTDSTYTTGRPGIFGYISGAVDDFQADNVGGGASFVKALPNLILRGGGRPRVQ